MNMVLSELWQQGDRICLIEEIDRILAPSGTLMVAERVRKPTTWLMLGMAAFRLQTDRYWRAFLSKAGFHVSREANYDDLLHCYCAVKGR
jgi:hypothetical protein